MGSLRIINDDIDELLVEILRRDQYDTEFGIVKGVDYSDDTNRD